MDRRNALKAAAWSIPVIAVAVAAPAAAASTVQAYPVSCLPVPNHGHGGNTGQLDRYIVTYTDGTVKNFSNSEVMTDKTLKNLCKVKK